MVAMAETWTIVLTYSIKKRDGWSAFCSSWRKMSQGRVKGVGIDVIVRATATTNDQDEGGGVFSGNSQFCVS